MLKPIYLPKLLLLPNPFGLSVFVTKVEITETEIGEEPYIGVNFRPLGSPLPTYMCLWGQVVLPISHVGALDYIVIGP
jgi:hypothetical protein